MIKGARPTRRRFISLSAAAAGTAFCPLGARAGSAAVRWRGRALGAPAEMILHHPDRAQAERLIRRVVVEIDRLEHIFSLYRPDSALATLNARGALTDPPVELIELLEQSHTVWALSGGMFDPTVQPLWLLHARHFSTSDADPAGPPRDSIEAVLARTGFEHVAFDRNRIAFRRPRMGLTLNGVAQGYITDRAVDILRAGGVLHTLADLGEIRALGPRENGTPWHAGIAGTDIRVDLVNRAIATSGTNGFRFAGPGSPSHLLNPRTGVSAGRHDSVSVVAPTATAADALSTAFSFMDGDGIVTALRALPATQVHLHEPDGSYRHIV